MRRVTRRSVSGPLEDVRDSVGSFSTKFSLPSFLKRVETLTDEQRNAIKKTGFGNLLLLPDQMVNKKLLAELIDHWSCEECAFVLRPGPIRITLMDVALILGLPVVGEPVILREDEPFSELEHSFGAVSGKRKIEVSFLKSKLDSLRENANDDFVRAFLLFTFGTLLFPSSTGKIDSRYASFLHNLDAVSTFAWGAAVLENLVFWLNKKKESNVQNIGGCLLFLQIWSYEHIDIARPSLLETYLVYPRICRWENSRSQPRQQLTTKFKELEDHQIIWTLQPTSLELQISIVKQQLEAEKDTKQTGARGCWSLGSSRLENVAGEQSVVDFQNHVEELDSVNLIQAGESASDSGVEVHGNNVETDFAWETSSPTLSKLADDSVDRAFMRETTSPTLSKVTVTEDDCIDTALTWETTSPTSSKAAVTEDDCVEAASRRETTCTTSSKVVDDSLLDCRVSKERFKELQKENKELKSENMLLREQVEQLRDKCSSLTSEVEDLRSENLSSSSASNLVGRLENIMLDFDWNPVG